MNPNDHTPYIPEKPDQETLRNLFLEYIDLVDEVVDRHITDEVVEEKLNDLLDQPVPDIGNQPAPNPSKVKSSPCSPFQKREKESQIDLNLPVDLGESRKAFLDYDVIRLIGVAHQHADLIAAAARTKAEKEAEEHIDRAITQAAHIVSEARHQASAILQEAQEEAERIKAAARDKDEDLSDCSSRTGLRMRLALLIVRHAAYGPLPGAAWQIVENALSEQIEIHEQKEAHEILRGDIMQIKSSPSQGDPVMDRYRGLLSSPDRAAITIRPRCDNPLFVDATLTEDPSFISVSNENNGSFLRDTILALCAESQRSSDLHPDVEECNRKTPCSEDHLQRVVAYRSGVTVQTREEDPLLTPTEVSTMFRVDPKTITRWAKAGKLTSIRTLGGHRRYRESEVRALLAGIPQERNG